MKQNNEMAMLELIDGGLVSADASEYLASNIKRALAKQNRDQDAQKNRLFEKQTRIHVTNLGPINVPNVSLPFELCKLPTVRKNVYYRNIVQNSNMFNCGPTGSLGTPERSGRNTSIPKDVLRNAES